MNYNLHCNSNRVQGMGHVGDVILIFQPYHQILCILKHIEDVEDRSSTLMDCSAMYVKDGKRTYTRIFAHNFTNIEWIFNPKKVLES